jgi:hypothetical protein
MLGAGGIGHSEPVRDPCETASDPTCSLSREMKLTRFWLSSTAVPIGVWRTELLAADRVVRQYPELVQACAGRSIDLQLSASADVVHPSVPDAGVGLDVGQWPSLVSEKACLSWQMLMLPRMPP